MIIIHTTIGFGGGVGTVIKNLVNYQLKLGHKVGIIFPKSCNVEYNEFPDKVMLFPIKGKNFKGFNMIKGVSVKDTYNQMKKKYPFERIVFHSHNPAAIGILNNIRDIPLVCTIHGVNTRKSQLSHWLTKFIIKRLIRNNVTLVGVSNQTSTYYNQIINRNVIIPIPNGVKIQPRESKNKCDKFTIGFIAQLDDLKGWLYLFEAYNSLENKYKEKINLIFAGIGNEENVTRLQELINMNNLNGNIQYLGHVKNAGNTLTPNIDLVVLPSLSEGIPMTLLEAIGNGVPILATKVGGIPEVLNEGENGYFITRDSIEIANYIRKIYDDKVLYQQLKQNCINIYNKKFTIEIMGNNYLDLYFNHRVEK